jgi:hypothetical protein
MEKMADDGAGVIENDERDRHAVGVHHLREIAALRLERRGSSG